MSKITDSVRFSNGRSSIGIVKVIPEVGPVKYYIGIGSGENEAKDTEYIARNGMPFRLPESFYPTNIPSGEK